MPHILIYFNEQTNVGAVLRCTERCILGFNFRKLVVFLELSRKFILRQFEILLTLPYLSFTRCVRFFCFYAWNILANVKLAKCRVDFHFSMTFGIEHFVPFFMPSQI